MVHSRILSSSTSMSLRVRFKLGEILAEERDDAEQATNEDSGCEEAARLQPRREVAAVDDAL